jgi:uncharacterized protein
METLTIHAARQIQLAALGLLMTPLALATKESVLKCIRQMGVLQIDTIHVVARSPYLVLFSRLGQYSSSWLDEHLAAGNLFEYWAHAACFIPIEDYAFFRRAMLEGDHHIYAPNGWLENHVEAIEQVRQRIRGEGALRSADFDQTKRRGLWWDWKDEKLILEHLFNRGELMINCREKFQRVYDLQERVLPGWNDYHLPAPEVIRNELVKRSVRCMGIARLEWVADYYRLSKRGLPGLLERQVQSGELRTVRVQDFEDPWYVHPDNWDLIEMANNGQLVPSLTTFLSPFDPLVWDRKRVRQLFNFDYSMESYLPASKRQYGYFNLPILQRGTLIGRLDAKAHRNEKRFEVRSIHLEKNVDPDEQLLHDLVIALNQIASWHTCFQVTVAMSNPTDLAEKLNRLL